MFFRGWFTQYSFKKRAVTKIQGLRFLLPLPSASYATSQSRGWLILGLTGVGDLPRRERSKPAHLSASAKNGSFLNASDAHPSSQVSRSIPSSNNNKDERNRIQDETRHIIRNLSAEIGLLSVVFLRRWYRVYAMNKWTFVWMLLAYIYNAAHAQLIQNINGYASVPAVSDIDTLHSLK